MQRDLLEGDLDTHFPGFSHGEAVGWGMAVGAIPNAWRSATRIQGKDWEIRIYPPAELKVPKATTKGIPQTRWKTIKTCAALVTVLTASGTLNDARDVGRRAVRSLLAIAVREFPMLLPAEVLWEGGVLMTRSGKLRMMMAELRVEAQRSVSVTDLQREGMRLAPITVAMMPDSMLQALQWVCHARQTNVRSEKFVDLWLAVLSLASRGQPRRAGDLTRISKYCDTMGTGIGGVRSPASIASLYKRLLGLYDIRNDLIHRSDDSLITPELLDEFETLVYGLMDFEFAKLGISLSRR